jgi:hypothetical protein
MKGIKGNLSSLSITDLMQWIDMNKKSGVLFVSDNITSRCFCFEQGKLLMASSNKEGDKFGEYIARESHVGIDAVRTAVMLSRDLGTSFTSYMIDNKMIPSEFLKVAVQQLAEDNITDILSWEDGSFEFVEELPSLLLDSPIVLNMNFIVFEAVRRYDEILKKQGGINS